MLKASILKVSNLRISLCLFSYDRSRPLVTRKDRWNIRGEDRNTLKQAVSFKSPIKLRTRGQTSANFPKKSLTVNSMITEKNPQQLRVCLPRLNGFPCPFSDKSLIRNMLTFQLGRDLGPGPRGRFVEAFFNGKSTEKDTLKYQGLFSLKNRSFKRKSISKKTPLA